MSEYAVYVIFTVDAKDGFEARDKIGELLAGSDIDPDKVANDCYVLKAEEN